MRTSSQTDLVSLQRFDGLFAPTALLVSAEMLARTAGALKRLRRLTRQGKVGNYLGFSSRGVHAFREGSSDPQRKLSLSLNHSDHVRDLFVSYSETLLSNAQHTVVARQVDHNPPERRRRRGKENHQQQQPHGESVL